MAAMGLYQVGDDEDGDIRFNDGGREFSVFDLMPCLPALSPRARITYIPFANDYDINTTSVWDETAVDGGGGASLAIQDAVGNKALMLCGNTDNDHYYYEYKYEKAQLIAGKDIWFYTSIQVLDADDADLFVGLCADLASGTLFDNRVDNVGFTLTDGSGLLYGACGKDGTETETTTGLTLSDATEYWVGFHSNGVSYVDFFAGAKGSEARRVRISTNLPDDEILAPAIGIRRGATTANSLTISDIWCISDR
jgi:hypothetical protein